MSFDIWVNSDSNRFQLQLVPQVSRISRTDALTFKPCRWTWIWFRRLLDKYSRARSSSNPRFCQIVCFWLENFSKIPSILAFLIKTNPPELERKKICQFCQILKSQTKSYSIRSHLSAAEYIRTCPDFYHQIRYLENKNETAQFPKIHWLLGGQDGDMCLSNELGVLEIF